MESGLNCYFKGKIPILIIALLFMSFISPFVNADLQDFSNIERLDQECHIAPNSTGNMGSSIYNNYLGQSFVPSRPVLSSVDLYIYSGLGEGSVEVTIYKSKANGYPNLANQLAKVSKTESQMKTSGWHNFDFVDVAVIPGDTYFIRVDSGTGYSWKNCGDNGDTYQKGEPWVFLLREDFGFVNFPEDFFFRTYYTESGIPPISNAGADKTITTNELATFCGGLSYDPNGIITEYLWDLGDGEVDSGLTVTHKYRNPGTYHVTLTVTDNEGLIAEDVCIVTVIEAPNIPPCINITVNGFIGHYYNLPSDHQDVEGPVTGIIQGDLPSNHDWYDEAYYSFSSIDTELIFNSGFFPVDDGLDGDPYYFATHWEAQIDISESGLYEYEIGSDDDSWLFIDDVLITDLGGTHSFSISTHEVNLTKGTHKIDIYFAERHKTQSGFHFDFIDTNVTPYSILTDYSIDNLRLQSGETLYLSAENSYDLDGQIVNVTWNIGNVVSFENKADYTPMEIGFSHILIILTDDKNSQAYFNQSISIVEPYIYQMGNGNIVYGEMLGDNTGTRADENYTDLCVNFISIHYPDKTIENIRYHIDGPDKETGISYTVLVADLYPSDNPSGDPITVSIRHDSLNCEEGTDQIERDKQEYIDSLPSYYKKIVYWGREAIVFHIGYLPDIGDEALMNYSANVSFSCSVENQSDLVELIKDHGGEIISEGNTSVRTNLPLGDIVEISNEDIVNSTSFMSLDPYVKSDEFPLSILLLAFISLSIISVAIYLVRKKR